MQTRRSYLSERQKQLLQVPDSTLYDYSDGSIITIYPQPHELRTNMFSLLTSVMLAFNRLAVTPIYGFTPQDCDLCRCNPANKLWKIGNAIVSICAECTQCVIKSTMGDHIIDMIDDDSYMIILRADTTLSQSRAGAGAYTIMCYIKQRPIVWADQLIIESPRNSYVRKLITYFHLYNLALQYSSCMYDYLPREVRYHIINLALHDNPLCSLQ